MLKNLTITVCIYVLIGFIHSSNIPQHQKYEERDTDIILISSVDEIMESKLSFQNFPQDTSVNVIIVLWSPKETTNSPITLVFPGWLD